MVRFELNDTASLTKSEKKQLENARKMPVAYDEDSPELTDEMERAFIEARKENPYRG